MRVLLDEDVPRKLVRVLAGHDVYTVVDMMWQGIKNGDLITLVEKQHFAAFVTGDKSMENQQRLTGRSFAVLILSAINWPVIRSHALTILQAINTAEPGLVVHVECGEYRPTKK